MRIRNLVSGFITSILLVSVAFCAETFKLDPVHSNIGFSVKHMGVSNVKGKFSDVSGTLVYDDKDVTKSSVKVTIKATSINTENEGRDKHLRSADFFDVEKYPEITFESKSVKKTKDGYTLNGTFTMHGISKEISIPFDIIGSTKDPKGSTRMGVEGAVTINRQDYKVSFNKVLDNGGLIAGNDVKISLDVEWMSQK